MLNNLAHPIINNLAPSKKILQLELDYFFTDHFRSFLNLKTFKNKVPIKSYKLSKVEKSD
jgi:hypothetical protein